MEKILICAADPTDDLALHEALVSACDQYQGRFAADGSQSSIYRRNRNCNYEKYKTWLMHCWLEVGDQAIMGADMDVGWAPNIEKPKNGFDVTLHGTSIEEARQSLR